MIDEAIRLIGQRGYHGFTVQALAEQCGLTNAGVLHYFGSKDQLLLAVLDEIERREGERITPLVAVSDLEGYEASDVWVTSQPMLRAMMEWIVANPEQARFITALRTESMDPAHPAHFWFRDREIETVQLFTRVVTSQCPEPDATARHLIALMYGLVMQWLRTDHAFDLVGEWARAARIALGGPVTDVSHKQVRRHQRRGTSRHKR